MGSIIRAPIKLISKAVETVADVPRTILGGITGGGDDPAPPPAPEPEEELEVDLMDLPSKMRKRRLPKTKKLGGASEEIGGYGIVTRPQSAKSIMSSK